MLPIELIGGAIQKAAESGQVKSHTKNNHAQIAGAAFSEALAEMTKNLRKSTVHRPSGTSVSFHRDKEIVPILATGSEDENETIFDKLRKIEQILKQLKRGADVKG